MTPLVDVSELAGRPLWLKCESLQPGGAFKIRGAYNMVAQLTDEQRAPRRHHVFVGQSRPGGRARGARRSARRRSSSCRRPRPQIKVDGTRNSAPKSIFEGTTTHPSTRQGGSDAAERGLTMVPPFDHEWIIAGQGTLGLEILDQCPDVGTVLVPVGGGGLVSGVAAAIKLSRPDVAVVGVEPSGAASMKASIDAGEVRDARAHAQHRRRPDGGAARRSEFRARATIRATDIDTVEDEEIAGGVGWLFTEAKIVAEPSGAATVAAALRPTRGYTSPGRRHHQRRQPRSRGPAEVQPVEAGRRRNDPRRTGREGLVVAIERKTNTHVEVTYALDAVEFNEVKRVMNIIFDRHG